MSRNWASVQRMLDRARADLTGDDPPAAEIAHEAPTPVTDQEPRSAALYAAMLADARRCLATEVATAVFFRHKATMSEAAATEAAEQRWRKLYPGFAAAIDRAGGAR